MKKFIVVLIIIIAVYYMSRNKLIKMLFNEKLTPNFTLGELLVTSQPFPNIPDEQEISNLKSLAVNVLQPIRNLLGVPITINSAFRSHQVNKAVGGVDDSQHRQGFAADIVPIGIDLFTAFKIIAKSSIPYDQLIIEENQRGNKWIHVSYSKTKSRRQLLSATWNFDKNKMDYKPLTV
jgi:zinc D-Ala-D-Ala carboxypeptidase